MTPVDSIMYWYLYATAAQHDDGMNWYYRTHEFAKSLSDDIVKAAGVISAYSPRMSWDFNVAIAKSTFDKGVADTRALGHSVRKANAILNGADPVSVLKGDKTVAFYNAILSPDTATVAVIDRHAANIARGVNDDNPKVNKTQYRALSDAYVECASIAGVTVSQMQAITWITYRAWKGIK